MKVGLVIFVTVLGCQAISDDEVQKQWKTYQVKFEKTYKSPIENRKRLSIFKENLQKIEAHNMLFSEGKETFLMGMTPFTDWTSEEFMQYVNKYQIPFNKTGNTYKYDESLTIPDTVDWRDSGAVSAVKNQGQCGSCWSFSATGSLEGAAKLTAGLTVSLSEQNLIDCATSSYKESGCDGGNMVGAFEYVKEHGITTEADYPYRAIQGTCTPRKSVLYVKEYVNVLPIESILQQVVARVGPVSVGMQSTNKLQHYSSGVLNDKTCTNKLNHGVLVVGYGIENNQDYWLVKNSWGADWGESGYFKLARNSGNNCGITLMASYPTVYSRGDRDTNFASISTILIFILIIFYTL